MPTQPMTAFTLPFHDFPIVPMFIGFSCSVAHPHTQEVHSHVEKVHLPHPRTVWLSVRLPHEEQRSVRPPDGLLIRAQR